MLKYAILEREESVNMLICFCAVLAVAARAQPTLLRNILLDILSEGLTTILILHVNT